MAETVKGTRRNGVYKVNQRTGEVSYEGQYGGRGSQSIRNSIRSVGARQAARTAAAYRTPSTTSGNSVGGYLGTMPRGSNYARNLRESLNRLRATTNLRQTRYGRIVASNTSSRRRG